MSPTVEGMQQAHCRSLLITWEGLHDRADYDFDHAPAQCIDKDCGEKANKGISEEEGEHTHSYQSCCAADMCGHSTDSVPDLVHKFCSQDVYDLSLIHISRTFLAKEYIELLGTYSDHIAIEEKIRTEFFTKIEETINQYGGTFTIYDTIDLQLARKP